MRVECPECKTSYVTERLGLRPLAQDETAKLDIACVCCKTVFHVTVAPKTVTPGWWARTILRRKPQLDGHEVR